MDMTDKDNKLLEDFFLAAREQQLPDNGFTERVMQQLPETLAADQRARQLSWLWTAFCIILGICLFIWFRGWIMVVTIVEVFFTTVTIENNLMTLLLCSAVLAWFMLNNIINRLRLS